MDKAQLDNLKAKVMHLYGKYLQTEFDEIDNESDNVITPEMLSFKKEQAESEWKLAELEWQEAFKLYLFKQRRIKK